jgi:PAS domain S-box-containing protein
VKKSKTTSSAKPSERKTDKNSDRRSVLYSQFAEDIRVFFQSPLTVAFQKSIFEGADAAIIGILSNDRIYFLNPAAEKIFNVKGSKVVGRTIQWLLEKNNFSTDGGLLSILKSSDEIQRLDYTFRGDEGRQIELNLTIIPVFDPEDGSRIGTALIARDITAQKIAEFKLRASEAFYHSLVETLPQNIFRKDLEGRFTFANRRFCQTLGVRLEDIIGKTDYDFFPPELARKYQQDDKYVIEHGKTFETIEENQPPSGGKIYVQVCKTPIRDSDGRIIGIQGIFWDITEQKIAKDKLIQTNEELAKSKQQLLQALNELERSHEELKAAQNLLIQAEKLESVGRLAAGVAHEVKNPLAIIQSGIDCLQHSDFVKDPTLALVIKDMQEALERADSVVRGMLDFAASQEIGLNPENINNIIEGALTLLRHDFIRNRINVVNELSENLPPVLVDKTRIEQVLVNLLLNAIHAMPSGGTLTVRTYARVVDPQEAMAGTQVWGLMRFDPGETVVTVEIDDTGTGIPPEILPRLFEPFCTSKKSSKGTGLGLAVSKKIMEMHGGTIEIFNRKEGGARARLTLKTKTG